MLNPIRSIRHILPVKVLGRLAGYFATVALTSLVVLVLYQFDFGNSIGQHHHHHIHDVGHRNAPLQSNNTAPVLEAVKGTAGAAPERTAAEPARSAAKASLPARHPKSAPALAAAAPAATAASGSLSKYAPGAGGCKEMKKMVILHWDPHWEWHRNPNGDKEFLNCEKARTNKCIMWYTTSDRAFTRTADIIVAHDWSGFPAMPERAFPSQLFMYMTMESPYSGFSSQHTQHMFNLEYKYMLTSHVRAAYIPIGEKSFTEIHDPPHYKFADKIPNAVSSLVSNCGGFVPRLSFMKDLNERVPIHAFGRCFHNHELKSYHDISSLEQYKVAMVFENSLCYDYVTEKWWRALTQATIPLVTSNDRIPDYRKYAPLLDAYVDYGQFKDMDALAAELKKIMTEEAVYNKYMAYRSLPEDKFNPLFRENFSNSSCDDFCRLALKMLDPTEMGKLVKRRNTKDDSCRPHGVLK